VSAKRKKQGNKSKTGAAKSPGDEPETPAKAPRLGALHAAFGLEIRRRRTELGITLEELAKLSGLTPNYIGKLEHGRVNPALSTMILIARGLGLQIGELLGDITRLSASAMRVGRLLDQAPPAIRRGVLSVLRGSLPPRKPPPGSSSSS